MSSNHGDGGESGEQSDDQTAGQGGGQPQEGQPQGGQGGQSQGSQGGQPQGSQGGQPQPGQGGQPQGGQPPQGQPPGGQAPQGQPPAGQPPVRRGPSASEKIQAAFGDYGVKNLIKAVVGAWAIIGLSFGLTPLLLGLLGPGGGLIGSLGVGLAFGTGPVVAGLLGLSLSNKLPVEALPGAVVSAAVNYVGFVVMLLIAAIFLMAQAGGGAGAGFQFGQLVVPLIVAGIPVAIAGALATALGMKVNYPATREEAEAQEPPAPPAPPQQPRQPQQQP